MTELTSLPPRPAFSAVLWRVAWPFFLFCGVLLSLLALSWTLLLPRYTRIDVGGTLRSAEGIEQYRSELAAQIAAKEEERRQMVLAVHDPSYDALKDHRRQRVPLEAMMSALIEYGKTTMGDEATVHWSGFDYDPAAKTLVIRGDIRDAGARSMTMLAQFADSLHAVPFVASVTVPPYGREDDPRVGFRSPFVITLTLQ